MSEAKEEKKNYYFRNREKILKRHKSKREEMKEKASRGELVQNYPKEYYHANKERILAKYKSRYDDRREKNEKNYDEFLAKRRQYYYDNKEKILARLKREREILKTIHSPDDSSVKFWPEEKNQTL